LLLPEVSNEFFYPPTKKNRFFGVPTKNDRKFEQKVVWLRFFSGRANQPLFLFFRVLAQFPGIIIYRFLTGLNKLGNLLPEKTLLRCFVVFAPWL